MICSPAASLGFSRFHFSQCDPRATEMSPHCHRPAGRLGDIFPPHPLTALAGHLVEVLLFLSAIPDTWSA
jgi:hypothetical protein